MEKIQSLRKLALKIDVSGSVAPISNTKLYQGSFGFVLLQFYVPVTQNRTRDSESLCTVHRTTIDSAGDIRQFDLDKYNLLYVSDVEIEGTQYMLFEAPLPKAFTDTVGALELVFNYSELKADATQTDLLGRSVKKVVARLTTKTYCTTVEPGGVNDTELVLDISAAEAAQINENKSDIERIGKQVDSLIAPPDVTEADRVGTATVKITETGNLKFSNLKGKTGDVGIQGASVVSVSVVPVREGEDGNVYSLATVLSNDETLDAGEFTAPKGADGKSGADGKDGESLSVYAFEVEDGRLVLYKEDKVAIDTHYAIDTFGNMKITLN